jgi:hypothetical protein
MPGPVGQEIPGEQQVARLARSQGENSILTLLQGARISSQQEEMRREPGAWPHAAPATVTIAKE